MIQELYHERDSIHGNMLFDAELPKTLTDNRKYSLTE